MIRFRLAVKTISGTATPTLRPSRFVIATNLIVITSFLLVSGSSEEQRISVYSNTANFSVTVTQRNNAEYAGLLDIIEPLGTVSAKVIGNHWKLRYNDIDCEFVAGKNRARIRGSDFELTGSFLLDNGRGLVPISSFSTLLPRILGGPIVFNESARRLLVGNIAIHFTAEVTKSTPTKLVINFSAPVNPTIATEPGKVRMVFNRDPVVGPGSKMLTFGSPTIPSATFQESNGQAELDVNAAVAAMASFSNDGRTITIQPAATASAQSQPAPVMQPAGPPQQPTVIASSETGNPSAQLVFAVIDAAHGGDERGAALADQLAEKDVTLAIARGLRQKFIALGLSAFLVRDSDMTLGLDQRAAIANAAKAAIYICIHATSEGSGVRLYSALMPDASQSRGLFIDWNTAQASSEGMSQTAGASIVSALKSKQIPGRMLIAPLRPLNNVTIPAIAIEVGSSSGDTSQLNSAQYQATLADTVASGFAEIKDKLQEARK